MLNIKESSPVARDTAAASQINQNVAENILLFEELTCANAEKLITAGDSFPYLLSYYSPGCLLMWKRYFNAAFTFFSGCAIIKLTINHKERFLFPYACQYDADPAAALGAIERYTAKKTIPLLFLSVPSAALPILTERYADLALTHNRNESEYIYLSSDMAEFTGKKFSGQRNHINKFLKLYPGAIFREYTDTAADRERLVRFWVRFEESFAQETTIAAIELRNAKKTFCAPCVRTSHRACVELDGEIISICYGESFGDMLIIHVEKALGGYAGVYQFMVNSFAKAYGGSLKYINRQDDAGSRGLRISKLQYHPIKIENSISLHIKTGLEKLREPPEITTARLILSPIAEHDIDAYNRLCLDDEHNKYWGYNYKEDIAGEPEREYFYADALRDYENKLSLTLAIRQNDRFIGEAVINEFDYRGGANVGLRLLPEYTGQGFAKEALDALCNYALYKIGLSSISAYCNKQNGRSIKMLSSCMERSGEDAEHVYFNRMT